MKRRVIQWATGAMGKSCLRAVLDHPDMELVGLFVYGDNKVGRDAGDIARRPLTGVLATQDVEEILALDADVVIHCARLAPPYGSHDADLIRLLQSGKNVISINGYSRPHYWGGTRLAALEAACAKGGSSLMAAGLNPGFAAEQIAVAATAVCSKLQAIEVLESVDCRQIRSPDYAFGILGFGSDPASINPNDPDWSVATSLNGMYSEVLASMANSLGLTIDRIETDHVLRGATEDLHVGAGPIAKGTVSHIDLRWRAFVQGQPVLNMGIAWYMEYGHLDRADPPLWRIHVTGNPNVSLTIDLEKPQGDQTATSAEQLGVAGAVINTIPLVCDAPAGVLTRPTSTPHQGVEL